MITDEVLSKGIANLLDSIEYDKIPIIDVIKIDNALWGRVDILINRFYNGNMLFLPFLLAFNKITDISEMRLGMSFEIPDFSFYTQQLKSNDILESDIVPGISSSTNNLKLNFDNSKLQKNQTTTMALPKLNIELKKVSYDKNSGIITF